MPAFLARVTALARRLPAWLRSLVATLRRGVSVAAVRRVVSVAGVRRVVSVAGVRRGVSVAAARRVGRRLAVAGVLAVAAGALVLVGGSLWVRGASADRIYAERDVPEAPVALVLGAQVYDDGTPSAYLAARLDLARRLLDAGKVRALLLSGDHGRWEYDEPGAMRDYLVARGVPAGKLVLDYAGFDTYDSCARANRIFGVRQAIVVTQSFHVGRAVALCRNQGIDATGVGDDSVKWMTDIWNRNLIRERAAVAKAVWDATTDRDPVYLGRQETGIAEALTTR